jgi:hypothetical protein
MLNTEQKNWGTVRGIPGGGVYILSQGI